VPPLPPEPAVPPLPPEPLRPADPLLAPEPAEPLLPPEPPALPVPPLPVAPAIPLVPEAASLPGSVVSDPHATNWDNTNKATLPLMLIIFMPRIYDAGALFEIRLWPSRIERLPIIGEVVNHLMGLTSACSSRKEAIIRAFDRARRLQMTTDRVGEHHTGPLTLASQASPPRRCPETGEAPVGYDASLKTLGARPSFLGVLRSLVGYRVRP
jgi:hypothetical protein